MSHYDQSPRFSYYFQPFWTNADGSACRHADVSDLSLATMETPEKVRLSSFLVFPNEDMFPSFSTTR